MYDWKYYLEGNVHIPEEKRAQVNQYVLKLCGFDSTDILNERVYLETSFLEEKTEKTYYDMNTCKLVVNRQMYEQNELLINLIWVLLEAYSETPCYFMNWRKPGYIVSYAQILEDWLGISLSFKNRGKVWEMMVYFKKYHRYRNMTVSDVIANCPYGYCDMDCEQAARAYFVEMPYEEKISIKVKQLMKNCTKKELCKMSANILVYALEIIFQKILFENMKTVEDCMRSDNKLMKKLSILLNSDIDDRKKMAEQSNYFGWIAEASLYLGAHGIVKAYSWAKRDDFWKLWLSLKIKGMGYEVNVGLDR